MDNAILNEYQRLNSDGRYFVDSAIKAAVSNPAYLENISEEEKQEIKCKNKEIDWARKVEDEKCTNIFEELKAESENYTEQDYIAKMNEVFAKLPWYKLRYFYLFINGKLSYDVEGGVVNG